MLLSLAAAGCHEKWHYWSLHDVRVSLPATGAVNDEPGEPDRMAELLHVQHRGEQTVFIAAWLHDDPDKLDDESGYTFVVVLDGPPKRGRHEITPENGRLIEHSPAKPPYRPYVGMNGRITILSELNGEIWADCSLKAETKNGVSRSAKGWFVFKPVDRNTRALNFAGVRLIEATPTTQPNEDESE